MSTNDIETMLINAGIQPTAQRIAVCQCVLNGKDHPSVEEVKMAVDKIFPKISLATVYNTLNTLVKSGLLRAVKLPHKDTVIYDKNTGDHYHFIDNESGKVYDLPVDQIDVTPNLPENFQVDEIDIYIRGRKVQ